MKSICITNTCKRPVHGHGYCLMHYKRLKNHGSTELPVRQPINRLCGFDGCTQKHDSHGYCANHARQYRKYGHPLSSEEIHLRRSESTSKAQLAFYSANPDRPIRKVSAEKRALLKGRRMNTGRTHFKKGFTPWNKDTKGLLTAWNKGKKGLMVAWNKGLVGVMPRPHNKIGDGVTSQNKLERRRFNKQIAWQILARDNYTCQICDQYSGHLHVDHIRGWADYPNLRFVLSNCRTVCRACHYYITYKKSMPVGSMWGLTSVTKKAG